MNWRKFAVLLIGLLLIGCGQKALIPLTGEETQPPAFPGATSGPQSSPSPAPTQTPGAALNSAPTPQYTPPLRYLVGAISGEVWWDVCFPESGTASGPTPASPACAPGEGGAFQANGNRDPNEPGIYNLEVRLGAGICPAAGLATAWTNEDGIFLFSGLSAGKYCVSIDPAVPSNASILERGGWSFPGPTGASQTITLLSGESRTDVNFGWDRYLPSVIAEAALTATPTSLAQARETQQPAASSPTQPAPAEMESTARPPGTPEPGASATPQSAPERTAPARACLDRATFLEDVTIPDNTILPPGAYFVKTWRIRNEGDCTWRPGEYTLAYIGGDWLGGSGQAPLRHEVNPGETVEISAEMYAPTSPGTYTTLWVFRLGKDATGSESYLGVGSDGTGPLYARIIVAEPSAASPGGTPLVSVPPTSTAPEPGPGWVGPVTGVSFEPGTTSATVEGELGPGQSEAYSLRASAGHALIATLGPLAKDLSLEISGEDGTTLPVNALSDGSYRVSELPSNQRYRVRVIAGRQGSPYFIQLEIPALISLGTGGSADYGGTIRGGRRAVYLLRGTAGQRLLASVAAPDGAVSLTVSDFPTGQPVTSTNSITPSTWDGILPEDQAYLISIVPFVDRTDFTLQVSAPPSP